MSQMATALVGRARHVGELRQLVDGVAGGRGHLVVLSGEAGAGKTRLAEEAVEMASSAGVGVAWATCWGSASAPLSTWFDLVTVLDPTTSSGLEGSIAEVDREAARALLVRSLVAQLRRVVAERPTLLVVDDLQWCDPLSLHAIEALVGTLRSAPLGLVATFRHDEGSAVARLDGLTRAGRHLLVPPLTEREIAELAVEMTGRELSPSAVARLHDRSAGNVLFARELLAHAGTRASAGEPSSTPTLVRASSMFDGRLAALSEDCLHLLQVASIVGRRFRIDVLAETLRLDGESVLAIIDEAHHAGLVRSSGIGSFEFAHPLMAEACDASAGIPRRARLHRDVAEALERLRDRGLAVPTATLAHHFASAAAAGVAAKAVRYAAAAGRASMERLAYEDAARDLARALAALELCPADERRRVDLLLDLADALAASGDLPEARRTYGEAAALARRNGWPELLVRAALGVGSGPGGFEVPPFDAEQIALLEEAVVVATGTQRAHALARLSVALSLVADVRRRADLSDEAVTIARDAGDALALGHALASWCDVVAGPVDVERRLAASEEILECASAAGDTRLELLGRRFRVVALLEAGALDAVDDEINAFADRAERLGQVVYSWYVQLWRAMRAAMEGRLDAAETLRNAAARTGADAHSENAAMLTDSQRAMLRCEIRDTGGAIAFFADLSARWPGYEIMARPALAYAHAAAGDAHRARELLDAYRVADYTIETLGSEWLPSLVMSAHAIALSGKRSLADEMYAELSPHGHRHAIDGIGAYDMGSVERPLGMLAALMGDRARAAEHFDAALREHRRIGARLLVAGTLRDAGHALGDDTMVDAGADEFAALGVHDPVVRAPRGHAATSRVNVFRRDGEVWAVGLDGRVARVRDSKGMRDLARLLARPGNEVHVLDLVADGPTLSTGPPGDPLDDTARRQYRARLAGLERDLAEADELGDGVRSERLHAERDALIAELSAAYGLGGRTRRRGASSERARSAVTQRIRDAITRIEGVDAPLGGHLRRSVRTGTYCAYLPDEPVTWDL